MAKNMRSINSIIKKIIVENPHIRTFQFESDLNPIPGQYAMVWIRGMDEVPMSFSGPNAITVQRVGEATERLFSFVEGMSLGIRGPLGNGFSIVGKRILLIGGGVGVAPLSFLGKVAAASGISVTSVIGFRSYSDAIFIKEFQDIGELVITTDDGSAGIKGFVSSGLADLDLKVFDQIYLCGPEMMMMDVLSKNRDHASKIQACINRYFKCAEGVCGSCCLDPDGIRVCVEGPVIAAYSLLNSEFGIYRRGPSGTRGTCKG